MITECLNNLHVRAMIDGRDHVDNSARGDSTRERRLT